MSIIFLPNLFYFSMGRSVRIVCHVQLFTIPLPMILLGGRVQRLQKGLARRVFALCAVGSF